MALFHQIAPKNARVVTQLPHHRAWLSSHPKRTAEWLKARISEGFVVHHVDGDDQNNDDPLNLILIDGVDHVRLHNRKLKWGLAEWQTEKSKARNGDRVRRWRAENREHYNEYMRGLRKRRKAAKEAKE